MRKPILVCAALVVALFSWWFSWRHAGAQVARASSEAIQDWQPRGNLREETPFELARASEESTRAPVPERESEQADARRARSRLRGIRGRVLIGDKPAAGANIFVQAEAPGSNANPSLAYSEQVAEFQSWWSGYTSDRAGEFLVAEVTSGAYALRFEHPRAGSIIRRSVLVPEDRSVDLGDIVLEKEAVVRGTIVPPVDESASSIRLTLDGAEAQRSSPESPEFEFRSLTSGVHELEWVRRDGVALRLQQFPGRLRVVLKTGEVRDVVVDATAHATGKLRVRVLDNGSPAANCLVVPRNVEASPTARIPFTDEAGTDQNGSLTLRLTPGRRVHIEVFSSDFHLLGRSEEIVELVPGEERQLTIVLALGTVVVELPPSIPTPAQGRITLQLRDAQDRTLDTVIGRTDFSGSERGEWTTNRIDFGRQPAGAYKARVLVEHFRERPTPAGSAIFMELEPLRTPFETTLVVEAGREAVIVVQ